MSCKDGESLLIRVDFPALVKQADNSGLGALWVRDVPFYDPNFGDAGQMYDITATLGYLAALTEHITIGSSSVLPSNRPRTCAATRRAFCVGSGRRRPPQRIPRLCQRV